MPLSDGINPGASGRVTTGTNVWTSSPPIPAPNSIVYPVNKKRLRDDEVVTCSDEERREAKRHCTDVDSVSTLGTKTFATSMEFEEPATLSKE